MTFVPLCMNCGNRHFLSTDCDDEVLLEVVAPIRCPGCLERERRIEELLAKDADKREKRRDYQRNYMRSYRK